MRPENAPVVEPANPTFRIARAPTIPADEAGTVPIKYNFSETFQIPDFSGKRVTYERNRRGEVKKDVNGKPIKIISP